MGAEVVSVRKETITGKRESFTMTRELPDAKKSWKIEKFSKLKIDPLKMIFSAGDRQWMIELYPEGTGLGEGSYLSLYLALAEPIPPSSIIYTHVTLRLLDQAKDRHIVGKVSQAQNMDGQDSLHSIIYLDSRSPFWLMIFALWKQRSECLELLINTKVVLFSKITVKNITSLCTPSSKARLLLAYIYFSFFQLGYPRIPISEKQLLETE
ncbi:uncharacterized protein LOC110635255 isoform X2 [Hevea brasiliensis]|uniref:uncharacterized protein LOC110635255 isoform X2 n=1 Tax=Hevea brasiliensis TaxID=3981 RepID=UPI0025EBCCF8|nr:uncharacterized protein LOC110635255 isoform X2 [Hevea brasiliensis]